jgi:hypothetical protein
VTERADLPDPASLLALLVAGDRLPVVAALVLGARTLQEIAERTGLPVRDVLRVLTRLESAGLASVEGEYWTLHTDVLREVVTGNRWPARDNAQVDESASPKSAAVLRAFVRGGRLLRVPAQRTKRLVILDYLAGHFEPGVSYTEPEVNEKLSAFHPDYAALRRYLVEEDFLARENGIYWRVGGSVDV